MVDEDQNSVEIGGVKYCFSSAKYYQVTQGGVFFANGNVGSRICSLLGVETALVNAATREVVYVVRGISEIDGQEYKLHVPRQDLLPGPNNPVLRLLMGLGAYINTEFSKAVLDYIATCKADVFITFPAVGWHIHNNNKYYVLPDKIYGAGLSDKMAFVPKSKGKRTKSFTSRGSLQEWKAKVGESVKGNPLMLFAMGLGFLGPLLDLIGMEGGIAHLYGVSSGGKTTLLQAVMSIYGNGSDPSRTNESLVMSWLMTSNAMEVMASEFNDLPLALDELGMRSNNALNQEVYMVVMGEGKQTMNPDRSARDSHVWKVQAISSGEAAIGDTIEGRGKQQPKTGQLIRALDISVDEGIFTSWEPEGRGQKVTQLKSDCALFYGTAKEPYLELLVEINNDPVELIKLVALHEKANDKLKKLVQKKLDPAQERVLRRFGAIAVALMLAAKVQVLDVDPKFIFESLALIFNRWCKETNFVSEGERGFAHLKQYVLRNPGAFVAIGKDQPRPTGKNFLGYLDEDRGVLLIFKDAMSEVTGRSHFKPVVRKLDELGLLVKNNNQSDGTKKDTYKMNFNSGGSASGYAVNMSRLMKTDEETMVRERDALEDMFDAELFF